MAVRGLDPVAADVRAVRAELDELLRARQYAAQRERRLTDAVRAAGQPDRAHGYAQPHQQPDPELLRQLDQAQTLREGLGVRCLELSERLLVLEDRLREDGQSVGRPLYRSTVTPGTHVTPSPPVTGAQASVASPADRVAPAGETSTAIPRRKRPTGARFGGVYQDAPDAAMPVVEPPPARGARFAGASTPAPAAAQPPIPTTQVAQAPTAPTPQLRTAQELSALTERITDLHRRGSAHESAAVVAQAAVTLAPADVARLAAMLRTEGPNGSPGYLARATAHGAAEQAIATLTELRRIGLVEEAGELFHALWALPAGELPELLTALERAGQPADGQTLLWEWASAPPSELADLAARLRAAGRSEDVRSLLRQAAGRPIREVAAVALALDPPLAAGGLIGEAVRLRSAVDLGELAGSLRHRAELYEALLTAVSLLEESRARAAIAALRSAGLPTESAPRPRSRR